jgi:hypothetical protein
VRRKKIDAGRLPAAAVPLSAACSTATAARLFTAAARPHYALFFLSLQVSPPPVAATASRHRPSPPPQVSVSSSGPRPPVQFFYCNFHNICIICVFFVLQNVS